MNQASQPPLSFAFPGGNLREMSTAEFVALRKIVYQECGIKLDDSKREMLAGRLARRLRHHGFQTYNEYLDLVTSHDPTGSELHQLINCVTTNKTEFFRENHHFEFLRNQALLELQEKFYQGGPYRVRIWCAASSTGEEPYTLAMTLLEHFGSSSGWDLKILASDIDSDVLAHAQEGIYEEDRVADVPTVLRAKYFRALGNGTYQVIPELRDLIAFRRINLIAEPWPIHTQFDLIFCRNVIIYFDRPTQQRLLTRMASLLHPTGYLVLGHSENIIGLTDLYESLGQTVHRLSAVGQAAAAKVRPSQPRTAPVRARPVPAVEPRKVNIVVGDIFASREPCCIETILGSCVAVCLFDPVVRVGGMNHFMLPGDSSEELDATRFGGNAITKLLDEIIQLGAQPARLQAKLFGGAQVVDISTGGPGVGELNAQFAQDFLAAHSIPVVSSSLKGSTGLIVRFLTHTGQALVKPCHPDALNTAQEGCAS